MVSAKVSVLEWVMVMVAGSERAWAVRLDHESVNGLDAALVLRWARGTVSGLVRV